MRWNLSFAFWIVSAFCLFSSRPFVSLGANPTKPASSCDQLLQVSQPTKDADIISVDLKSRDSTAITIYGTSKVLFQLYRSVYGPRSHDSIIQDLIVDSCRNLFNNLHIPFFRNPENHEAWKESLVRLGAGQRDKTDLEYSFNRAESADDYEKYLSPMQYYFSTVMVTYAAIKMKLKSDKINITELGVAIGDTTKVLKTLYPAAQITAVDQSIAFISRFQERHPGIPYIHGNIGRNRFIQNSESQDLVVSIAALSQYLQIDEVIFALKESYRILKPGGFLLFEIGPTTIVELQKESLPVLYKILQSLGFETEEHIGLGLRINGRVYYPILLRKK